MTLYLSTASHEEVIVALRSGRKIIAEKKFSAPRRQAETLVPAIAELLRVNRLKLTALKKIIVANRGGSFTSLRIGVITANALAFALRIPVEPEIKVSGQLKKFVSNFDRNSRKKVSYNVVEPDYGRAPKIGPAKKKKY